jgi:DNA-binding response OmpR family regulator
MKPEVLVVESDLTAFAVTDRRLHDRFRLVWASTWDAALMALGRRSFDAVLVRADAEPGLAFISRVKAEFSTVPVVAIAPWEVQGDRACVCGAKEWVSAPINYPRLAAVLDFVSVEARRDRGGALRAVEALA